MAKKSDVDKLREIANYCLEKKNWFVKCSIREDYAKGYTPTCSLSVSFFPENSLLSGDIFISIAKDKVFVSKSVKCRIDYHSHFDNISIEKETDVLDIKEIKKIIDSTDQEIKESYLEKHKINNCPICGSDNYRLEEDYDKLNKLFSSHIVCSMCQSKTKENSTKIQSISDWNEGKVDSNVVLDILKKVSKTYCKNIIFYPVSKENIDTLKKHLKSQYPNWEVMKEEKRDKLFIFNTVSKKTIHLLDKQVIIMLGENDAIRVNIDVFHTLFGENLFLR